MMIAVVAFNLNSARINEGFLRWSLVGMAVFLVVFQVVLEWNRRYWNRQREEWRWNLASQASDPVAFLARSQYLDRLTVKETLGLFGWVSDHPAPTETDLETAPEVVRGYYALSEAPRESW